MYHVGIRYSMGGCWQERAWWSEVRRGGVDGDALGILSDGDGDWQMARSRLKVDWGEMDGWCVTVTIQSLLHMFRRGLAKCRCCCCCWPPKQKKYNTVLDPCSKRKSDTGTASDTIAFTWCYVKAVASSAAGVERTTVSLLFFGATPHSSLSSSMPVKSMMVARRTTRSTVDAASHFADEAKSCDGGWHLDFRWSKVETKCTWIERSSSTIPLQLEGTIGVPKGVAAVKNSRRISTSACVDSRELTCSIRELTCSFGS